MVINADSMQVYRELAILTARPRLPTIAELPHRLYGILPADDPCSAARWCGLARAEIAAAATVGRLPIVVGGTGLYLKALIEGLSPVPDIPADVRAEVRIRLARLGPDAAWRALRRRDPVTAGHLRPGDSQRVQRAYEVFRATGRSLSEWRTEPRAGGYRGPLLSLLLLPPRPRLYANCDRRFGRMLSGGALDEAAAVLGLDLDPALPAMKAVGLRELMACLRGGTTLPAAAAAARQATRNYAKRQTTWFRHQMAFDATPTSIAAAIRRVADFVGAGSTRG